MLRGILPPLIRNLSTSLQYFQAHECDLKGNILPQIDNLNRLIIFNLVYNDLDGIIPLTMGILKQLQGIALDGNNLQGSIPYDLCHLEALNGLMLSDNTLSSQIPPCFLSLISLRELNLGSNNFSYGVLSSLWSLEHFLQQTCQIHLSGSLSLNILNFKALVALDSSRNYLSSVIPIIISGLKELQNMSFASN